MYSDSRECAQLIERCLSIEENCLRGDGEIFRGNINSAVILGSDGFSGRVIMIEHASN
jgi:hypothetical protein